MPRLALASWKVLLLTTAAIACYAGAPVAAQVHDESIHGDLSTDPEAPTPLAFSLGSNLIRGDVVSPADGRDFITFIIPAGRQLDALHLIAYTDLTSGGPGNTGFNAINAGDTSFVPGVDTIANFLGANHIEPAQVGMDILPGLAAAPFGGSGFSIPLGPGTYSYLMQQTGSDHVGYEIEFVLTPEPASAILLLAAAPAMLRRRRTRAITRR